MPKEGGGGRIGRWVKLVATLRVSGDIEMTLSTDGGSSVS